MIFPAIDLQDGRSVRLYKVILQRKPSSIQIRLTSISVRGCWRWRFAPRRLRWRKGGETS